MLWVFAVLLVASGGSNNFAEEQVDIIKQIADSEDQASLEASLQAALDKLKMKKLENPRGQGHSAVTAVIGGGLSGLTAALALLEEGVPVALIDKSKFMGGNSAKASSGINGALTTQQSADKIDDSADRFFMDTLRSSTREEGSYTGMLARKMADDSKHAVDWIQSKANVELPDVGQMGGHSAARTHRPRGRLSGAAFVSGLERAVMKFSSEGLLTVHKRTALVSMSPLLKFDDQANPAPSGEGWELGLQEIGSSDSNSTMIVRSVVLATGGFSADKTPGGLLSEVAPHLTGIATTNGAFATGDGIKIARGLGAKMVDLDMVQVHPTGFSDVPAGFKEVPGVERPLILCAEILRGVGGVLLEATGARFVNELDTRKAVTNKMNMTGQAQFVIALPPAAAEKVDTHVHIYTGKKLLHKVSGAAGVAEYIHKRFGGGASKVAVAAIEANVKRDFEHTSVGNWEDPDVIRQGVSCDDPTVVPFRAAPTTLPNVGDYYVGVVQPVLHYTMGGVAVNAASQVVSAQGNDDGTDAPIVGLYAGGEIIGGVHGVNRLGGSSLLDCVVFGLQSAKSAAQRHKDEEAKMPTTASASASASGVAKKKTKKASAASDGGSGSATHEAVRGLLSKIPIADRKSVKIGDAHFDISQFVELHPGGAIDVEDGDDLTPRFLAAHGKDWGLLRRDEIVPVTKDGKTETGRKKEEEHHLANYGGKGGSWREIVGRHSWFLIHSIAAKFPEYPTEADRVAITGFITALGQLYPCKLCRKHLQQQLRDPELGPVAMDSRTDLTMWICKLHNIVNKDIGKPLFNCNPLELDLMYLKNCGECEVVKKGEKETDASAKSGFHPTSGPWDALLYLQDPLLLAAAKSSTDVFEIKRKVGLIEAAKKLRLPKKQIELLNKAIRGPGGKALASKLQKAIAKSSKVFKDEIKSDLAKLKKK